MVNDPLAQSLLVDPCPDEITWFQEYDQCSILITTLTTTISTQSIESTSNRLIKIYEKYQEQPFLLDKHLEDMISPIVNLLQKQITNQLVNDHSQHLFRVLYYLTKVRGYKTVLRFFSHEVTEYESILTYIDIIPQGEVYWETRYILILWLSLVVTIPFDLSRLDMMHENNSIIQRTLSKMKKFLHQPSKESESAGLVIAKLLTRRDVIENSLDPFIDWCKVTLSDCNQFSIKSILSCIASILKIGQRELLLSYVPKFKVCILALPEELLQSNSLCRKFIAKINQRLALCALKPRIAAWRYNRGSRSLNQNIGNKNYVSTDTPLIEVQSNNNDNTDEVIHVDESIEEIIGSLMEGLQDRDTIVRWSCAKGVGRVTERLPRDFAAEVIDGVLALFDENVLYSNDVASIDAVSDSTWHGACLALAEFARRGLLLPEKLDLAIPWVSMALKFDQRRGSHSIGSHVRDAACYVCWSFARAYAPEIMKPYVHILAKELVIVSVFDREVNIRRASSASFQENVGRQGIFPNGIDIIVIADYTAVGNRSNSYLEVAMEIGKFDEYRLPLINYISNYGVVHWDKNIRDLASKSLARLSQLDPEFVYNEILPVLIQNCVSQDLNVRHGSLIAIGEVCVNLSEIFSASDKLWFYQPSKVGIIIDILKIAAKQDKLNTFGSELLRSGCCRFISGLAISNIPIHDHILQSEANSDSANSVKVYWSLILSTIQRKEEWLQKSACETLHYFMTFLEQNELIAELDSYTEILLSSTKTSRTSTTKRGFTLSLSYLSTNCTLRYWKTIQSCLIEITENITIENDAEVRRNAITSLARINHSLCDLWMKVEKVDYDVVMSCFIKNMSDYTIDSRGDVGSLIREACFTGCFQMLLLMLSFHPEYSSIELNSNVIGCLLKQSIEKIDRTRELAGSVLLSIIAPEDVSVMSGLDFEYKPELQMMLKRFGTWLKSDELYPVITELLYSSYYRPFIIEGLSLCVGGLGESLVRNSSSALLSFLSKLDGSGLSPFDILNSILDILKAKKKVDRVTTAVFETLNVLISGGAFQNYESVFFVQSDRLLELIKSIVFKSKDIKKLSGAIKVACGISSHLIESNSQLKRSNLYLTFLSNYLVHPFPMIRKLVAEELYLVLINEQYEGKDELDDILLTVEWTEPVIPGLKVSVQSLINSMN